MPAESESVFWEGGTGRTDSDDDSSSEEERTMTLLCLDKLAGPSKGGQREHFSLWECFLNLEDFCFDLLDIKAICF